MNILYWYSDYNVNLIKIFFFYVFKIKLNHKLLKFKCYINK